MLQAPVGTSRGMPNSRPVLGAGADHVSNGMTGCAKASCPGGTLKKCVNSQAVYPLSEQHGLEAQERRYTAP